MNTEYNTQYIKYTLQRAARNNILRSRLPMRGMSEMQRKGAMVCMMETTMTGGVSDLVTRLARARASTIWMTARTTRPVLKVMTRGSAC